MFSLQTRNKDPMKWDLTSQEADKTPAGDRFHLISLQLFLHQHRISRCFKDHHCGWSSWGHGLAVSEGSPWRERKGKEWESGRKRKGKKKGRTGTLKKERTKWMERLKWYDIWHKCGTLEKPRLHLFNLKIVHIIHSTINYMGKLHRFKCPLNRLIMMQQKKT